MSGNSFGGIFRVITFGESHGPAVGCVIDGCPAGLAFSREQLQRELDRRRPGGGGASTTRRESDEGEILSGLFEGMTLGTPIAIIIRSAAHHSSDYDELRDVWRPGHADFCWDAKYGRRDHNGGGRSSARETAARVAAGAVAKALLAREGVSVCAWTAALGAITAPAFGEPDFNGDEIERNSLRMPCAKTAARAEEYVLALRGAEDSAGGIVACRVEGLPTGWGEPVFDKLDAALARAMLSLGAAKGVEFGRGFDAARLNGSENNDAMTRAGFASNNAGGVLGGISMGTPLEFRVAFKPVPSIAREQRAIDRQGGERLLRIKGRHDVCVCPRAVPVVEAMCALVLADMLLAQRSARI